MSLEVFPNPYPNRRYEIHITTKEFTNLCPFTGQPDFAQITIRYTPSAYCVELKSLKLYLQSFRTQKISHEALVNKIVDDFTQACHPSDIEVIADFHIRGGLHTTVRLHYEEKR